MAVELTDDQQKVLEEWLEKFRAADDPHRVMRAKWDDLDALYHAYRDLRSTHASGRTERDRYGTVREAQGRFGPELFPPYAFATVETVLPRMLSNRPRMLVNPRDQRSEANVDNVRFILDAQQENADYELKLQTTGKSGLHLGIGIQKGWWRRQEVTKTRLRKRVFFSGYAEQEYVDPVWDDPDAADVSPYDFLWDPYGDNMESVGYVFHRTWRSTEYVLAKIEAREWGDVALDREALEGGGGGKQWYSEVWAERKRHQGGTAALKGPVHEVLEGHDRAGRIVTIVDRKWPVAQARNTLGRMPFHIYRPTEILHEFAGKGVIEPMRDLQREANMLRSNRMWNALAKLHQSYFYEEGTLDPKEIVLGPGMFNAVNGPPRDLLMPVTTGDIPGSSYQEDAALQADIRQVTGISDVVSGTGDAAQTATGVQLIQAAAGIRIQLQTRRIEIELIKPMAEHWLELDQQRIVEARDVGLLQPPKPGGPERAWSWKRIGPDELAGRFSIEVDGGSTAPKNVPQDRQDAQILLQTLMMPGINRQAVLAEFFKLMGFKSPESFVAPDQHVPPATLDVLMGHLTTAQDQGGLGLPPEVAHEMIAQSLNEATQAEQSQQAGGQGQPAQQPPAAVAA